MAYDYKRGEPRGKVRKMHRWISALGDCIDCKLRKCMPTGSIYAMVYKWNAWAVRPAPTL